MLALLATAALGLWLLLPGGALHAQSAETIEYAENGTGSVATFTANDPEGSAIISWSLDGDDAGDFKIEDGVLSFKKSPDYETPQGGGQEETDTDNIYTVTVEATDATKRVGNKEVTVEVTNVEEGGSMRLSALQPQAGTSFYVIDEDSDTAAVTDIKDDDGITSSITWQWSRSRSRTTGFGDIDKATNPAYTPKDGDNGYYLRVTASYTDREGPNKSAQETSDYPVQLAPSNNAAPKFADDQDPDTTGDQAAAPRTIAENTPKGVNIGSPIEASDLNPGKLTYTLGGTDVASFDIDRETGQLKTKSALDFEDKPTYEVEVRATDPSGDPHVETAVEANSDTVTVNIAVEDLVEDPQISDESIAGFAENGDITAPLATFTAVVEEGTVSRWSLAGPDAGKLEFDDPSVGALTFKDQPDYEDPGDADGDNVYEVTVRATDGDSRTGTRDVTVEVTNFDEPGTVTLSPAQHRVGVPVTAELKDADGGVYGLKWQWYDGAFDTTDPATNAIAGATSDTYAPKAGDVGDTLTAVATYRDAAGGDMDDSANAEGAAAVLRDTRNKAPVFKDSKGNTITMAERSIPETAAGTAADDAADATDLPTDNVGGTIMAQDSNIGAPPAGEADSLVFSLSGADASKFRVRQGVDADATDPTLQNVQVEVKDKAKFDYETKDTYMVTLTATDDYGETADLALTINITDVNEAPTIMVGGLAISGPLSPRYAEEATGAVGTYTLVGPNSASGRLTLSGGDDIGDFMLSSSGVLSFRTTPDYEDPADADMDNVYKVTLSANDGTFMASRNVEVTVTNVDEDGVLALSDATPVVGVALTATLDDPDGETNVAWQWALEQSNGSYTDITTATSDTYTPVMSDNGSHLRVTVTYDDGHGTGKELAKISDGVVIAGDPLVVRYDANGNGRIDKAEVITAINDYLFGTGADVISKDDVIRLINLYLFG